MKCFTQNSSIGLGSAAILGVAALFASGVAQADAAAANGYVVNSVNGANTTTNAPVLTVYAADASGHVVSSAVVTTSYWTLSALETNTAYTLVLSDIADVPQGGVVPPPSLPPGWTNDADIVFGASDSTADGSIAIVAPATGPINVQFGVHFAVPIPSSERNVLLALYESAGGSGWYQKAGWNGPPGTECNWSGVLCDYDPVAPHVVWLGFGGDWLAGTLPALDDLPYLQFIDVSSNSLTGAMPSLSGLTHLQEVWAYDNQLTGTLPSISGLRDLRTFVVFSNEFYGPLPSLQDLPSLKDFQVDDNALSGSIPPLSGLTNLGRFNVQGNYLTGCIPSISGLSQLYYFNVAINELTGTLPSLAGLGALESFRASYNHLEGSIPSLTGLTNLQLIAVGHNRLSGSIPGFSGLLKLRQVFLENNWLTGDVPAAPVNLYDFSGSKLCPNPLNTTPSANDAKWSSATGSYPWWSNPYPNNACDDLFTSGLGD